MPYEKVLVTHKFGIISQTHKKELLDRLKERRRKVESDLLNKNEAKNREDPINLQINEEFVKIYNEANFEKKQKLNQQCLRILEKLKKKLLNPKPIDDLTTQLCWAELSQLMQCTSPVQEECMDLFIYSLENTPLSFIQIPTLFFLAETIIYWIRTETVNQPLLRAYELKLLKVGHLLFQRIYFHHLEGTLDNQNDLKDHLNVYLNGFDELKSAYLPYPEACFYVSTMISIGNGLMTNFRNTTKNDEIRIYSRILKCSIRLFSALNDLKNRKNEALIESILRDLAESATNLTSDDWIETSLAFYIIGECSKDNVRILEEFIRLSGSKEIEGETNSFRKSDKRFGLESWPWELGCVYVEVLTEICIQSLNPQIKRRALLGFNKDAYEILETKLLANGFGLLEASRFQLNRLSQEDDWSWKIRYLAIKGLARICNLLNQKEFEEFRKICWCSLVILEETEKNKYVLEAIKVGQVDSKFEKSSKQASNSEKQRQKSCKFYNQIAIKLFALMADKKDNVVDSNKFAPISTEIYVETNIYSANLDKSLRFEDIPYGDLNNADSHPTTANVKERRMDQTVEFVDSKKRTTLRDEILLNSQFKVKVPGYFERKNFDLLRIVEDQYRKEIEEELAKKRNENENK